jgi:ankyrin repeat protein
MLRFQYLFVEMASKVNLQELKDARGRNLLHLAAWRGHLEVCRFLVEESGFHVNSTTPHGLELRLAENEILGSARMLSVRFFHCRPVASPLCCFWGE